MESAGSVVSHGESIGDENADSVESAKSTGGAECSCECECGFSTLIEDRTV